MKNQGCQQNMRITRTGAAVQVTSFCASTRGPRANLCPRVLTGQLLCGRTLGSTLSRNAAFLVSVPIGDQARHRGCLLSNTYSNATDTMTRSLPRWESCDGVTNLYSQSSCFRSARGNTRHVYPLEGLRQTQRRLKLVRRSERCTAHQSPIYLKVD